MPNDVDINTATFETEIEPSYKDPGAYQWGANVAKNTAYNYRHSDQNLFILNDEYTAPSSDRTYDTERDYRNKYVKLEVGYSATPFTMPFGVISTTDALTTEWVQLTTSFQTLPEMGLLQVRALNSGGFQFRMTFPSGSRYLLGSVTECRLVAGA